MLEEFEGEEIDGVTLESHTEFEVDGLGDKPGGLEFSGRVTSPEITLHATVVYFRISQLEAAVMISALDYRSYRDQTETAAAKLEARITGVALGEIDEDPVATPTEPSTARPPVERPNGVPDLASAAIQLSDLPLGFMEEEAYEPLPDQEFQREFSAADSLSVRIGRTEVIGVQNTVTVFDDPGEAGLVLTLFEQLLLSDEGRAQFATSFSQGSGLEAELSDFQSRDLDVGDDGIAIIGLVDTGVGEFAFAFMIVRVDRMAALINVTGLATQFNLGDLTPLARLQADRLKALAGNQHRRSRQSARAYSW